MPSLGAVDGSSHGTHGARSSLSSGDIHRAAFEPLRNGKRLPQATNSSMSENVRAYIRLTVLKSPLRVLVSQFAWRRIIYVPESAMVGVREPARGPYNIRTIFYSTSPPSPNLSQNPIPSHRAVARLYGCMTVRVLHLFSGCPSDGPSDGSWGSPLDGPRNGFQDGFPDGRMDSP